jgi:nucleoside-diphosphate-sugar epimerase
VKRVLIVGSTGVVGRQLVKECIAKYGSNSLILPDRRRNSWDVSNSKSVSELIKVNQPNLIVNLAASYKENFAEAVSVNVIGSQNILDSVYKLGLKARVVLIGSAAEYGDVTFEENPIPETRVLRPHSVYGMTKALQTNLANFYAPLGVDVIVARLFNIIGKGLSDRLLIGSLEKQIEELKKSQRSVIEVGNLDAIRDYISAEDAAKKLINIMSYGKAGEVYNVASGVGSKVRDIVTNLLEENGLSETLLLSNDRVNKSQSRSSYVVFADVKKYNKLVCRDEQA